MHPIVFGPPFPGGCSGFGNQSFQGSEYGSTDNLHNGAHGLVFVTVNVLSAWMANATSKASGLSGGVCGRLNAGIHGRNGQDLTGHPSA